MGAKEQQVKVVCLLVPLGSSRGRVGAGEGNWACPGAENQHRGCAIGVRQEPGQLGRGSSGSDGEDGIELRIHLMSGSLT